MSSAEAVATRVLQQYQDHVNPYLAKLMHFAGFGVEVRAEGCYLYDHEGEAFLDFLGGYGVFSLGHRHPAVVQAVRDQLDHLALSGKTFFNPVLANLAEALAERAPGDLNYVFFSNSGAEAVEAALKFAKGATGRPKIVATHGGYHGKTLGTLSATGREKYQTAFLPLMPGPVFVPYGDVSAAVAEIDDTTAAVIVEPIQGEGGIHVAPAGYLQALREACDATGALLIFDEVQTGMGRTGTLFGCEHDGVAPDLMTLAKALGGGIMPIGATLGTAAIWEKIYQKNPLAHTSTFGGNPLACAAGLATLRVVEEENLCARATERGNQLMAGLADLVASSDLVTEVRGRGLMVGVEFAMDEVGELVIAQMVKRGLVAAYTLNNPRVIRLEPPLIITAEEIDRAIAIMTEAVAETEQLLAAFA